MIADASAKDRKGIASGFGVPSTLAQLEETIHLVDVFATIEIHSRVD